MQQPKVNSLNNYSKSGFWDRQFDSKATNPQKIFDWIFGILLPAICFFFDPIVFETQGLGGAFLGKYKPFAYVLCYFSLFAMSLWLSLGEKLKGLSVFFSGLFLVGGVISLIIGIILLPFSLLGLFIVIGILGFTPLFTAFVFIRNMIRSFHSAESSFKKSRLLTLFFASALISFILPLTVNIQIEKSLQRIINGNAQDVYSNTKTLKFFKPIVNFDSIERYYFNNNATENPEKIQAIINVYKNLTGKEIGKESMPYE